MADRAMAVIGTRDLTPMEQHAAYIEEKRDIIKRMCIPEKHLKNDALFENFIEISKLTGLNPIRRQLYCIDYGQGPNIVTGIDGLRLIASRTAAYGGGDEYRYEDGQPAPNGVALPARATCTVYRIVNGIRCPFTCTVRWDEFGKKPFAANYSNNWKTMPYHMLGKVAESHALRRAFPEETSGLYTTDEMAQADGPARGTARVVDEDGVIHEPSSIALPLGLDAAQWAKFHAKATARGVDFDPRMTPDQLAGAIKKAGGPRITGKINVGVLWSALDHVPPPAEEDAPEEAHLRAIAHEQPVPVSVDAPIRDDEIVVEQPALVDGGR